LREGAKAQRREREGVREGRSGEEEWKEETRRRGKDWGGEEERRNQMREKEKKERDAEASIPMVRVHYSIPFKYINQRLPRLYTSHNSIANLLTPIKAFYRIVTLILYCIFLTGSLKVRIGVNSYSTLP
jgi:hypothetical protein